MTVSEEKKRVTVFWLIPAKPQRELFGKIIRILADEFGAPRFEPHLTLGLAPEERSPRNLLKRIQASPISLRIRGIAYSDKFTKTLFIRFENTPGLEKLVGDLGSNPKSLRDPHLSLIYRRLSEATKRELAATINLPFRDVLFDVIKAVNCVSPTETRQDVENWHVTATKRLSA